MRRCRVGWRCGWSNPRGVGMRQSVNRKHVRMFIIWCFLILSDIQSTRQLHPTGVVLRCEKTPMSWLSPKERQGHPAWGCLGYVLGEMRGAKKESNMIQIWNILKASLNILYIIVYISRHGMIWPLNPPQQQRGSFRLIVFWPSLLSQPRLSTGQFAVLPPHVLFLAAQDVKREREACVEVVSDMISIYIYIFQHYLLLQNSQGMLVHGYLWYLTIHTVISLNSISHSWSSGMIRETARNNSRCFWRTSSCVLCQSWRSVTRRIGIDQLHGFAS